MCFFKCGKIHETRNDLFASTCHNKMIRCWIGIKQVSKWNVGGGQLQFVRLDWRRRDCILKKKVVLFPNGNDRSDSVSNVISLSSRNATTTGLLTRHFVSILFERTHLALALKSRQAHRHTLQARGHWSYGLWGCSMQWLSSWLPACASSASSDNCCHCRWCDVHGLEQEQ